MNLIDELEREKNHADSMAAMCDYWMNRALKVEREKLETVIALVRAAGGSIAIDLETVIDMPYFELSIEYHPANNQYIYRTRRKDPSNKTA